MSLVLAGERRKGSILGVEDFSRAGMDDFTGKERTSKEQQWTGESLQKAAIGPFKVLDWEQTGYVNMQVED